MDAEGIEPSTLECKTSVFPLAPRTHISKNWNWRGYSKTHASVYGTVALPLELRQQNKKASELPEAFVLLRFSAPTHEYPRGTLVPLMSGSSLWLW